jgi:hypothetical protein
MAPKKEEDEPITDLRRRQAERTRPCYQVTIPSAHFEILSTEADLWGVGKGEFLTMLLRRKRGELAFERPQAAPRYRFSEKQLREMVRYAWYLPPRDVEKLEEDRVKLGNVTVSSWVTFVLNNWIGQPEGVGEQEIVRKLLIEKIQKTLPDDNSPAEPYWALFEITSDGKATGSVWAVQPGEVVLFEDKRNAQTAANLIGPPDPPASAWAVRGVSQEYLRVLQSDPNCTVFVGTVSRQGELRARALEAP